MSYYIDSEIIPFFLRHSFNRHNFARRYRLSLKSPLAVGRGTNFQSLPSQKEYSPNGNPYGAAGDPRNGTGCSYCYYYCVYVFLLSARIFACLIRTRKTRKNNEEEIN